MNDIHIVRAELRDLERVHALIESAYRGESARAGWTHEADLIDGPRITAEELRSRLGAPTERFLLALAGDVLVGSVSIADVGNGRAYLSLLAVDPTRQTSGIGRALMAAAEREAVLAFGSHTIELTVIDRRAELVAFYERRGYVRTGEVRPFPVPTATPLALAALERPIA